MKRCLVFGSNREGRHGKGVALTAKQDWGAKYYQAEGLMGPGKVGYSYAIVTKELRLDHSPVLIGEIREGVQKFLEFASSAAGMEFEFNVTEIGCGLAGYTPDVIAPEFDEVLTSPGTYSHVILPPRFVQSLVELHLNIGGENDNEIAEWTVADIIGDLTAYDPCFEWFGEVEPDDIDGTYKLLHERYGKDIQSSVKIWRAKHLTGVISTVYHHYIRNAGFATTKQMVEAVHGRITDEELKVWLRELHRLGLIHFPEENADG